MSDALRRVFLSYARADSTSFVDRLERDLKAQQFQTWVDRHGLEGGEEWMEIIQQAIDECLALVVVLSPAAMQSQFVRMEYRYAVKQGKLVIPALHIAPPRTPMDLDILQWVDFQASYEEGLRQLAQALSRLAPAKPIIQSTPAPAASSKTKEQWRGEGLEHRKARRYKEALAAYDQAILLDPKYALVYVNKGNLLYEDLHLSEEALAAYDQAIQLDPKHAGAYNGRGNALNGLKRYEEALIDYDQAITLNPQYAPAYNGRGNALDDLKRSEEALASYDRAITLDPKYASAYFNKGVTLRRLQRYTEAFAAYDQAIKLDPQYASAYNGRGNVFRDLKRYEEALIDYDQAIKLNPQNGMFCNNKANTLERLGRKEEAEQARQKARELGYKG